MSCNFLAERITKTKLMIIAYEDAILALTGAGAIEVYDLDTGQTRTRVTRSNLKEINDTLEGLYNRLNIMEARAGNSQTSRVIPNW